MVLVKDNVFNTDLSNLIAKGCEGYQWRYHHKSDMRDSTHNKFFVSLLWDSSSEHFFFNMLWKLIQKEIPCVADYYCWRIIANGQIKGQNGNWHTDHGDKTLIYFPLAWAPEWGGSSYFKVSDAETEIQYQQNRLIIFDSNVLHYGSCPTIDNILRISIAFNLNINKS